MPDPKWVVVLGGGFAGATLARELDGGLPPGYSLLVVSEDSYTTFNPLLPEMVGAPLFPDPAVASRTCTSPAVMNWWRMPRPPIPARRSAPSIPAPVPSPPSSAIGNGA
jgi:hypothetical protein